MSGALADFMREVAGELRQQERSTLFLQGPGEELSLTEAGEKPADYDWKADDGRAAYMKEGRVFLSTKDGGELEILTGRRPARRLDFKYTGHRNVPLPGALKEWGG
mmetsp:Transcript_54396/g.174426  ORF Transcript_54396/g.174426 Transcript_54396/m.174426 type:complete len:106 (+) Transcript_54396:86-403(+)